MSLIELRPLTPDDLPEVCALHNRSEAFDGVPRVLSLDELVEELESHHVDLGTDARLALVDGELAGYVYTLYLPSEVKEERCYVFGEVEPRLRRRGVGSALLQWGAARGEEQLRSSGRDLPRFLRVDSYDFITDAHALFARHGFTPVRWFDELLRPLTDLPPSRTVAGVTILPWDDDRCEEILATKNEAFLDHWGSAPQTLDAWTQHTRGFGARQDLSCIAVDDDDRVIGCCFATRYAEDDELLGRSDGWIDTLATLAAWRGRGVGSAMLVHSLHAFAADGLTHASIGVDSDNPSGAARLYRALGFEPERRSILSQIEIV
ncbi:MAG: GNAT family N-acetyltransferase [Ilumatobacteraceae bacterium]|nr:GNAT family N-acetyltransferase [Ilumatobacteraceae bacterium]